MKLEHIDRQDDEPLLRIFDFNPVAITQLIAVFRKHQTETAEFTRLEECPFIEAIQNTQLQLETTTTDHGVTQIAESQFRCSLTVAAWDNITGLTEPFTEPDSKGYQWLDDTGIPLLLSRDGLW